MELGMVVALEERYYSSDGYSGCSDSFDFRSYTYSTQCFSLFIDY